MKTEINLNNIVKIINNPKTPEHEKKIGRLLHGQGSTAGGQHIIKDELLFYINNNLKYIK